MGHDKGMLADSYVWSVSAATLIELRSNNKAKALNYISKVNMVLILWIFGRNLNWEAGKLVEKINGKPDTKCNLSQLLSGFASLNNNVDLASEGWARKLEAQNLAWASDRRTFLFLLFSVFLLVLPLMLFLLLLLLLLLGCCCRRRQKPKMGYIF